MDNQVIYTVTANDMISGKLQGMNSSAQTLGGTMGGLSKIMGTLGIGFAIFKGLEFVKAGIEKIEELHQATAQVQAVLTSTNNAAGLSMKQLEESASSLASNTKFSQTDVFGMQSLLLTFTSVKDKIFNEAQPAIMDLAQRMGGDLKGASIQVGKALNDPIQGMTALRRVGVSFSDSQKTVIKHLQETGDLAGAQKIILKELSTEFGGSAQAAFNADPLAQFNKTMGGFQKSIGLGATALLEALKPALDLIAGAFKSLGNGIKSTIAFFEKHTVIAETLKVFLGAIVAIIIIYNAQQKLSAMYTAFTTASFIAQTFSAGMLTASLAGASTGGMILSGVMALLEAVNPFVWWAIAIAAVITAVVYAYQHFETFRAVIWAIGAVIKEYVMIWVDLFKGFGMILQGVFTLDLNMIQSGFNKITDTVKNSATRIGKAAKDGYTAGMNDFAKDNVEVGKEKKTKGLAGGKPMAINGTETAGVKGKDSKANNVSGSKVVTINVTIGSLINDFQIKTTNLQESTTAIREKVVQALTGAINQSQITAGA